MANGNNAGQQGGGQQNQAQPAGGAAAGAAGGGAAAAGVGGAGGGNPPAPAFDAQRARHEAAHAVTIDDYGYQVTRVNINPAAPGGGQQLTQANWGAFQAAMNAMNWDNAAQRDAIRPMVLQYVTTLVAGHLADNLVNGAIERISTRLQNNPDLLLNPPNMQDAQADRERTALFLFLVQRNTLAEVVDAEARALEILTRRAAHHTALTDLLIQDGTVEGAALAAALGH